MAYNKVSPSFPKKATPKSDQMAPKGKKVGEKKTVGRPQAKAGQGDSVYRELPQILDRNLAEEEADKKAKEQRKKGNWIGPKPKK